MIVKGSQRGDARALAAHLLNARENETITVQELRGFVAPDLHGALREVEALTPYTRCRQPFFHVSLSPPPDVFFTPEQYQHGASLIEDQYPALHDQPRALVFHTKHGRQHAHIVWSRIDAATFTAVNLSHFKRRLRSVAQALARVYGLALPAGLTHSADRSPLPYDHAIARQSQRLQQSPQALKTFLAASVASSPTVEALQTALAPQGLTLARGDKRGFVVVHTSGEVLSLSRTAGVKGKALAVKYGDPEKLPTVEAVRAEKSEPVPEPQPDQTPAAERPRKRKTAYRDKRRRMTSRYSPAWATPPRAERYTNLPDYQERRRRRTPQRNIPPDRQEPTVITPDPPANDDRPSVTAVKALLRFDLG